MATADGDARFWKTVEDGLLVVAADDTIRDCFPDGFEEKELLRKADELFELADAKLHTFPFKHVKACWFRLYTDASMARALNLLATNSNAGTNMLPFQNSFDEIVSLLDMALIMAGGLGREDLIHGVMAHLQANVRADQHVEERPRKKRRKDGAGNGEQSSDEMWLSEEISIPSLEYPLQTLNRPSLTAFAKHMNEKRVPTILTHVLDQWPACQKWTSKSFWLESTIDGRRLVPIEVGRSYVDEDWGQQIIPFSQFIDTYISPAGNNGAHHSLTDASKIGYLAQHDLFNQLPHLRHDVTIPDYCYLDAPAAEAGTPVASAKLRELQKVTNHSSSKPESSHPSDRDSGVDGLDSDHEPQMNIWFGPGWTVSPLHHDPYHNILCQVVGKKYVRLYSPRDSASLHARSRDEPAPHTGRPKGLIMNHSESNGQSGSNTIDMSNTSTIDVAAMELSPHEDWDEIYPGISQVPYLECILEAGQALYIPIGWWHYVRSCSVGISVSFWW